MSDPAEDAAQRALDNGGHRLAAAREALKPIRDAMSVIKDRYDRVHSYMIDAETSAEMSRHASELAGLMFAYNAIAPSAYTSEELAQ